MAHGSDISFKRLKAPCNATFISPFRIVSPAVVGLAGRRIVMKNVNKSKLLIGLLLASLLTPLSVSGESIVYYRDFDGSVNAASKVYSKQMKQIAAKNGYVTLWLTIDYPVNVNFESMTPEELAEQEAEISAEIDTILNPLIERNKVWHPATGKFVKGPGCVVRATTAGLVHLLKDERILQITAMDD